LRTRFGDDLIQAQAPRVRTRRHNLAHVAFGILDHLVLVHENHAGCEHDENHDSGDDAGEQVGPKNNFVQQLHARLSPRALVRFARLQNSKLVAQPSRKISFS
jgi:hypothetical protein